MPFQQMVGLESATLATRSCVTSIINRTKNECADISAKELMNGSLIMQGNIMKGSLIMQGNSSIID